MDRSAVVSKTVHVTVSGPELASPCRQTTDEPYDPQEAAETALLHLHVTVSEGEKLLTSPWTLFSVMNIFKSIDQVHQEDPPPLQADEEQPITPEEQTVAQVTQHKTKPEPEDGESTILFLLPGSSIFIIHPPSSISASLTLSCPSDGLISNPVRPDAVLHQAGKCTDSRTLLDLWEKLVIEDVFAQCGVSHWESEEEEEEAALRRNQRLWNSGGLPEQRLPVRPESGLTNPPSPVAEWDSRRMLSFVTAAGNSVCVKLSSLERFICPQVESK
ncbi:Fc receptor-like protein [Sarotherodon galilaeus]